ncbi:MAG: DUF4258 domain-containing protein [Verrucomicrobiota bacterium]|nr:DUF4258 domain-containing protein [Verrucomicrobiota bacterium]
MSFATASYDQILELIDLIDDEEIDDRCTPDQIEKIADLMSFLAWKGTDLNDPFACALLEQDSYTLLCTTRIDPQFFPYDLYTIQPAVYEGALETTLCKSWVHKQCSQVKKFVKKHKKAIIIGAVVVAVVTVAAITIIAVAGTTAATSAAATAGAAAAGIAASQQGDHPPLSPQTSFEPLPTENPIAQTPPSEPLAESPILTKLIEEKTASLKETLLQEIPSDPLHEPKAQWTWGEKARELGSIAAHQILDTAADIGAIIPEARAELLAVKTYTNPEILNEPADSLFSHQKDPIGDYNATVASLHEKIDEAFSTDKAYLYTPEVKALKVINSKDCAVGMLPPPSQGFFGKKGWELKNPKFQPARNSVTDIEGRLYRGHALDQMQNRGIPPSIVEQAIQKGEVVNINQKCGTIEYYDASNRVRVILNEKEEVITVFRATNE